MRGGHDLEAPWWQLFVLVRDEVNDVVCGV